MAKDIIAHRSDHHRRSSMEFQQLGTIQGPDACRQAPRVSTRAQDAIPDP